MRGRTDKSPCGDANVDLQDCYPAIAMARALRVLQLFHGLFVTFQSDKPSVFLVCYTVAPISQNEDDEVACGGGVRKWGGGKKDSFLLLRLHACSARA